MSDRIVEDYPLERYNTLRLKVAARWFTRPESIDELRDALRFAKRKGLRVFTLGEGSNVLFRDDFDGLVLRMGLRGIEVEPTEEGGLVTAGAGENWNDLVEFCLDQGLYGLENLSLIPGSVGAAPVQNIGAYGVELKETLEQVEVLDPTTLKLRTMGSDECRLGYRHSVFKESPHARAIITAVRLRLRRESQCNLSYAPVRDELARMGIAHPGGREIAEAVRRIRRRRLPDPARIGNVGSFFKNPVVDASIVERLQRVDPALPVTREGEGRCKLSAAWLIDRCGLKGACVGGAAVSEEHALVLVNRADAVPGDFVALAERIQARVEEVYSLRLELEPTLC